MARIAGIELADNWKLDYALTKIRGIGWASSTEIVNKVKLAPKQHVSSLSVEDVQKITAEMENYLTEGDLLRKVREDIQRLREIGTYRGLRHARGLPVRGQRTKSNARTKRGKKKTVGSFRKDMLTKMQTTAK
ncbi:30S ribosomal protein S13 [Candidatus Microgenomates bacterium]|nr:MAG: 30S ribosomal protein S13 [Candidatus Microgenomates bacterium]